MNFFEKESVPTTSDLSTPSPVKRNKKGKVSISKLLHIIFIIFRRVTAKVFFSNFKVNCLKKKCILNVFFYFYLLYTLKIHNYYTNYLFNNNLY